MGNTGVFDKAVAAFSMAYADPQQWESSVRYSGLRFLGLSPSRRTKSRIL